MTPLPLCQAISSIIPRKPLFSDLHMILYLLNSHIKEARLSLLETKHLETTHFCTNPASSCPLYPNRSGSNDNLRNISYIPLVTHAVARFVLLLFVVREIFDLIRRRTDIFEMSRDTGLMPYPNHRFNSILVLSGIWTGIYSGIWLHLRICGRIFLTKPSFLGGNHMKWEQE